MQKHLPPLETFLTGVFALPPTDMLLETAATICHRPPFTPF